MRAPSRLHHAIKIKGWLILRNFTEMDDPFALFEAWFADAKASEPNDPNAMTFATVDQDGLPDARIVLMKDYDREGFVFYTNTTSAKGRQVAAQPKAALIFHWKSLLRQVRVRGLVSPVSTAEADTYYNSRARESRIGAWASQQSQPLESRAVFEAAVARETARFEREAVARPPHWSGYRIAPLFMEFWHDRPFRLHDRIVFARPDLKSEFAKTRLYP
jgi:pyridoxamine 5'-phosphate oxidase